MKITTMLATAAFVLGTHAATIKELNSIPVDKVTAENAAEVFDAAVASTNLYRIDQLVKHDKIGFEDAVRRTMNKRPLSYVVQVFSAKPAFTNAALVAEVAATLDYSKFGKDETVNLNARIILTRHGFHRTEAGRAEIARAYAVNKVFGAVFYLRRWKLVDREMNSEIAPKVYEEVKPLVKSEAGPSSAAIIWNYAYFEAKDHDGFASIYNKDLIHQSWTWLYPFSNNTRPEYVPFMKDFIEVILKTMKSNSTRDSELLRASKILDKNLGSKNTTLSIIDALSTSKVKLAQALYCGSIDKVLEILINCDTSLEAKDIDAVIGPINGLDPDYKTVEVVKALKTVNQRYTLKLYDDRDTWEPVLSKVRAMIDCR